MIKLLGKYVVVCWRDPTLHIDEPLAKIVGEPFSIHENNGKLVHHSDDLVVIEHDSCGGSGDYTTIDPSLITSLKPLKQCGCKHKKKTANDKK